MAHRAQTEFCREVKFRFPQFFSNCRVLEIGSRNINGTIRGEFIDCDYIGVDCQPGADVDVVCLGHQIVSESGSFDVVCALEVFEHDPYADLTIANMLRLLRPGGLFLMTCASEGREEHGTERTDYACGPVFNFYRNVTVAQWCEWLLATDSDFREIHVRHNPRACDLYCWAIKG